MQRIERTPEKISDLYDILIYAHGIRAFILLIQSRLIQSIVLPSLLLAKIISVSCQGKSPVGVGYKGDE